MMFTKTNLLTMVFAITMGFIMFLIVTGKAQTLIRFQDPLSEIALGCGFGALCIGSLFTISTK